ncbi:uncharacterized protein [Temnothorax nylanderi]|uniref:uncharacterized protein n=1 Tax=Temnothorax nylanderi TaxID=102681 RepID=UPI003A89B79B
MDAGKRGGSVEEVKEEYLMGSVGKLELAVEKCKNLHQTENLHLEMKEKMRDSMNLPKEKEIRNIKNIRGMKNQQIQQAGYPGFPEPLVDWVENMLVGRNLTVMHIDTIVSCKPGKGCPQGGVLSPLLWGLVVNDLLMKLQKKGFLTYGYADDIAIVITGPFLNILRDRINDALKIVQKWCEAKGLMVNPSKTSIMVFTRKYKPEPIEPFKLWGKVIPFTTSVKYLGLFIDTKLSWKIHLAESRKKFYSCMWMCRRAMSKSWGIRASIALWLHRAVLLPRLLYASVIWWPRTRKVEAKNLLKSLQGSYLRAAVGAMKTTPTEALEIALCIPPLDLAVEHAARNTAYRLKCQGEWRSTGLGHTRLGLLQKNPFTLKQDRTLRKYQLVKHFTVRIPTRKEWTDPKGARDPNVDLWFTDGSGINNRFGAGFYGPKDDHRESIPVGSHSTVFTAEILAILKCTKHLLNNNTRGRKINICSDSRAAILALAKATTESALVWDCMLALERLSGLNKVTLVWVPGHQGVPGNETADLLAKKGASKAPSDQVAGIPFAVEKEIIKSCLKREHLTRWENLKTCRQARTSMKNSRPGRAKELLALSKQKLRMAVGLLTGHSALLIAREIMNVLNQRKSKKNPMTIPTTPSSPMMKMKVQKLKV